MNRQVHVLLAAIAALAVFLSAATSQAAAIVVTDTSSAEDDFVNFRGVDAASASDYADVNAGNGVIAAVSAGSPVPIFPPFPVTRLNDGIFTGDGALFQNATVLDGRYHYDLVSAIGIGKITSYSSNREGRAGQEYSVWGSAAGTIPSTTTTLDVDDRSTGVGSVRSDLMLAGWTLIADVDVDQDGGSSGAMITPDSGVSLGRYRWLMFNVQINSVGPRVEANRHPNMMEIDVYQAVIPEPSTLVLAALGLLGLMGIRRRRNRNSYQ